MSTFWSERQHTCSKLSWNSMNIDPFSSLNILQIWISRHLENTEIPQEFNDSQGLFLQKNCNASCLSKAQTFFTFISTHISKKKSPRLFRRKRCLILVFYDNCLFWRVPWDFVLNSLCFELTWVSNFGKNLSRYKQQVGIIFRLVWWNIYRINGPEAIKSHRRP